jgi:formylglycine-generating enzyme required for sulfatase activity/dienelactone hydrolase
MDEVLGISGQVLEALAEAHGHGVVHRDIKPANVMITARGRVKVMDFGLATQAPSVDGDTRSTLTASGEVLGTVPYMSPEQVQAHPLDARSDIFSAGVMLFEMICGRRPFDAASPAATLTAILSQQPAPLARFSNEATPELERIVAKALRKDRESRYQTTKDLLIDLRTLQESRPPSGSMVVNHGPEGDATGYGPSASGGVPSATQAVALPQPTAVAASGRAPQPSWFWWVALAAVAVLASAGWFFHHRTQVQRAQNEIATLDRLVQSHDYFRAFDAAVDARTVLPADPTIARLMPTIADTLSVTSTPSGAQVYLRRYPVGTEAAPARVLAGTTPLTQLPIARGEYVVSIEKAGFAPAERSVSGEAYREGALLLTPPPIAFEQRLFETAQMPARMTYVPGGPYTLVAWSRLTDRRLPLDDFFIDKYEVSNREYKEFIDAGGYQKAQFWTHPFLKDGRTLSFDDAMAIFKDRTGLAGPRGWSRQAFPEGQGDFPVTDVSWYEASAYAAFRGKTLPTLHQWEKAARNGAYNVLVNYMPWGAFYPGDAIAERANFASHGPASVGSNPFGMSPFGVYNTAGNVSEWTLNETSQGHVGAGGAWGEPTYMFAEYNIYPGLHSSERIGFRCARPVHAGAADASAMRIDVQEEVPVFAASSSAEFTSWLKYYDYPKTPLNAAIVETTKGDGWIRQTIAYDGEGGDRVTAYLYLPANASGRLQVVHFVPASDVENGTNSLATSTEEHVIASVKAGRAAFAVLLRGYLGRSRSADYVEPSPGSEAFRAKVANWIIDLRRGLDYLETRSDLDATRIAFFGPSAGARMGLYLTAIDSRYRSVCLAGAGLRKAYLGYIASANPIGFAAHVHGPVLMVQGRYDENLPLASAADPLFNLLPNPKRLELYDGGHVPPIDYLVRTLNAWLDQTLGPVGRQ